MTTRSQLSNSRQHPSWKRLGILLLAISCSAATTEVRAELLVNGGFKDGLTGWTFTGNGTTDTASLSSDTPTGTGNSADLEITEGSGLPWLTQDVTVTPGLELDFTASVKELVPNDPDAWIAGQVWMLPSDLGSIISSVALFYTTPEWQSQTASIIVPPGASVARVLFTPQNPGFGVGTGQYLVDDVSLTIVPEPSSALLAGLFALLLGVRCRRK